MNSCHTHTVSSEGFTILELIIVLCMIAILLTLAFPTFTRQRSASHKRICESNLRLIQNSKDLWAIEMGQSESDLPVEADLRPFFRNSAVVKCPTLRGSGFTLSDSYEIGTIGTHATCRLFPQDHSIATEPPP